MKNIFLILTILSILNSIKTTQEVRGVPPERASLYDPAKPFTCLDGSSTIPFEQVNDDYCDCRDGSDEPGTPACMNSQFACENLGYIVQYVPSSRVNDGICDCCDGSDEYNGKVQCENKCIALAAQMREEEEKIRILKEQGFAKRQELIQLGNEFKKSLEAKISELEIKKTKTQEEKTELEAKKNEAELKAKEARDVQDKILEEKRKEQERAELVRKAKVLFELLDLNKDSLLNPEELLSHQELDILFDNDGTFTIEESILLLDNNNNVDLELFVSGYYEKLSPHLKTQEDQEEKKPEENTTESTNEPIVDETNEHDEHEHEHDEHDHEHDENTEQDTQVTEQTPSTPSTTSDKYDAQTQKLIDDSDEARRLFESSERDLRNIENEINDAKKKLELDLGPNGEFASMIDKCFEYEDREYIYKLCPFDKTVQKSKSNHGETSIGHWKSWADDDNNNSKYFTMKFDNGLGCWNGPQRSTKVLINCGTENKLVSVSEPNRCEYEMKFETPAVCDEHKPALHEEL